MPHLVELAQDYADRQVELVAVLSEQRSPAVESFLTELGANSYVVVDASGDGHDAYGIRGVPTTVIIDEQGRAMFRHVGFEEGMEAQFREEVDRLLAWMGA